MMKGYLTVFLSLSLSLLAGFVLFLTEYAIRNAEKIRLECAADTAMNAVLSEYHIDLFERYGLLYVDASYLNKNPSITNVEERLEVYLKENLDGQQMNKGKPWGIPKTEKIQISSFETAAADSGASMRHQAVLYVEDCGIVCKESSATEKIGEIEALNVQNSMAEWSGLMGELAGMELPMEPDEDGIMREVPLSNPADWVYGLSGNDVLFLADINDQSISSAKIPLNTYISHRGSVNVHSRERKIRDKDELFITYLFEKMTYLNKPQKDVLLSCQLEYLAKGKASDLENVRAVAEEIFRWRFADNVAMAFSDGGLRMQAEAAALELHAVQLKEDFREPVTNSILYACAFLESIGDVRTIYSGGTVPVRKSEHNMSVEYVKDGSLYSVNTGDGLTYSQYLACLLLLNEESLLNLRAMDVMEMDLRALSGNQHFAMDWCIERYETFIEAKGSYGGKYELRRKYGFF